MPNCLYRDCRNAFFLINRAKPIRASFVGYQHPGRHVPQILAMGIPVTEKDFGISTSNGSAMYGLVRDGAGIAFLPTVVAEGRPGLQRIRPDAPTFDSLARELAKDRLASQIARF